LTSTRSRASTSPRAAAALQPAGSGRPKLYSIDTGGPTAGAALDLGTIGSASTTTPGPVIEDIAIAPSVREFAALTNGPTQQLFTFFSNAPEDTSDPVNVTGVPAGVQLVGIDTRPANGQLVGVGDNERLYTINPDTDQLVLQGGIDGGAPQGSPNDGVLTNIGALGVNVDSDLGYDIVPEDNQGCIATDDAAVAGIQPNLYSVNPGGAAVPRAPLVGAIGAPAGKTVVGLAFLDDTVVSLASVNQTVAEGDGSAVITVTRDGDLDRTATARVTTGNGSATAPQDYGALTNTTVTFGPGETVKTVTVPINNDTLDEPNETFTVRLSPVTGRAGNATTAVKIADDDNPVGRRWWQQRHQRHRRQRHHQRHVGQRRHQLR